MSYRAEIDGLRAIAVLSVILYHAQIEIFGRDWFEGGFIGVDIFFVISGYLITRIILTELEQTNTFNFIKFYERRARRILPMLLVVIAVCIPFAWQKLLPLDLVDFAKSALSAIGFGSNFFFYFSTTEYGADSALLKPLLHTWSLGVEEQFYIVVPIIILVIWKFARASLLTILVGMLFMSIQFADGMEARNSDLNFFFPFSRCWELLIGSVLAFIELKYERTKNPILIQTLPIIGLFLIAHSILFFDTKTPHPSFQTLIPILGVSLVLAFCSTEDFVGKILSFKPIVGIGLISYSLYLWHYPILAFGRMGSTNPSTYDKVEWILLAFVLSIVSYFLIEKTFRNSNFVGRRLFFSIIFGSLLTLTSVNLGFILNNGFKERLPVVLQKQDLDHAPWREKNKDFEIQCHGQKTNFCSTNSSSLYTNVILLGDSHMAALAEFDLRDRFKDNFNVIQATSPFCIPSLNVQAYQQNGSIYGVCDKEYQKRRFDLALQGNNIVIVFARFPVYLNSSYFENESEGIFEGKFTNAIESSNDKSVAYNFVESIKSLVRQGNKVILVYPFPEIGINVPASIWKQGLNEDLKILSTDYDNFLERTLSAFQLFDSIQDVNIYRVYPHRLTCNTKIKGRCIAHDNTDTFYQDDNHPSYKGSEMIGKLISEKVSKAETSIRKGNQFE